MKVHFRIVLNRAAAPVAAKYPPPAQPITVSCSADCTPEDAVLQPTRAPLVVAADPSIRTLETPMEDVCVTPVSNDAPDMITWLFLIVLADTPTALMFAVEFVTETQSKLPLSVIPCLPDAVKATSRQNAFARLLVCMFVVVAIVGKVDVLNSP
jgi:hypothetical protein